jgi:transposase InsO family protein
VEECEDPAITAEMVIRPCLRERVSKVGQQPLSLHADKRVAKLESRLEELGVIRTFSRPRVSIDNPYSESLCRTVKYRPGYPQKPYSSKRQASQWAASLVGWYNHRQRHSGIKLVKPDLRHTNQAVDICQHRAVINEEASQRL